MYTVQGLYKVITFTEKVKNNSMYIQGQHKKGQYKVTTCTGRAESPRILQIYNMYIVQGLKKSQNIVQGLYTFLICTGINYN